MGRVHYISTGGAPPGSLASWHRLTGVADSYDLDDETDIAAYLRGVLRLNASGILWEAVEPKPLALEVAPYTWSAPDADFRMTATAEVGIVFPDGSRLSKSVAFVTDYSVPNRVHAVKLEDETSAVYTGLIGDYGYRFVVRGHAPANNQCALAGAFISTSNRTTLRLLGSSNKAQSMWPGNSETTGATAGVNFREMLRYDINASRTVFTQGGVAYTRTYSGTASGSVGQALVLLNEANGADYGHGILREARIYDGSGTLLRLFQAARVNDEIVIVDAADDNRIFRPASGGLVEVTA